MKYFCDVHIQSRKDAERRIFIVLENKGNIIPNLTKEILIANNQYKDFVSTYKPKLVYVEYAVYSTEEDVFANTSNEEFISHIENEKVKHIANSELSIDSTRDKIKKRRKSSFSLKILVGVGCFLVVCIGFIGGVKYGSMKNQPENSETINNSITNDDGMIVPEQMDFSNDSQQVTVSIDRSYSAVPKEDLQLKGEIIDGTAEITLPEFDRSDFFTHVSGYTWGFTSNPDGKKIEYYGGETYQFENDIKLYRVLVKYGGGNGTKNDPYLINYYDQFELMGEEKARGYFKQTCDISFPNWVTHVPVDTINELKSNPDSEHFEYDGNGYEITNLSTPLFGKISGAVIKNVNIKNSEIKSQEYKYYGMIVCEAYNYQYQAKNNEKYETGETLIKNCTVSHCGITIDYPVVESEDNVDVVTAPNVVPPDLIEYDENGNIISSPASPQPTKKGEYAIGAISGIGGQIEDCYITDFGIYNGIDDYFLYAGGISGKPANVINSAVYFYSAKGNIFSAGGIAGNAGGSKFYDAMGKELPYYYGGNIQGCTARKIIIKTEVSAGGITGEGGSDADYPIISNCYASELTLTSGIFDDNNIMKKSGITGGIIGVDGKEKNGHYVTNTVSDVSYPAIGNAIKSKYDESIRLAPAYAFNQENILTVINKNSIHPDKHKEIFTGSFTFGNGVFSNDSGSLPYPESIETLFDKTHTEENDSNE